MPVTVSDYSAPTKLFSLDPESGAVSEPADVAAIRGRGQWKKLGLILQRRKSFCAVFLEGDDLVLWLEGRSIKLSEDFTANVVEVMPFIRRFELHTPELDYHVSYFVAERDPWPDDGDLFSFVARTLKSRTTLRRAWYLWSGIADGKDIGTPDFLNEVEDWLNDQGLNGVSD